MNHLLDDLPWFHIVIFIPYKLPCCHKSHPHQHPCKAQFTSIFSFIHQVSCNIKPEQKNKLDRTVRKIFKYSLFQAYMKSKKKTPKSLPHSSSYRSLNTQIEFVKTGKLIQNLGRTIIAHPSCSHANGFNLYKDLVNMRNINTKRSLWIIQEQGL